MSTEDRLKKIKLKNLTSNKTYPPFIEYKNVCVGYESTEHVNYDDIADDLVYIKITDGTLSSPWLYKHKKTNQYYLEYRHTCPPKFRNELFDVTDVYDWEKVFKENMLKPEFKIKETNHIVPILEDHIYYPGSEEYDSKYPPVDGTAFTKKEVPELTEEEQLEQEKKRIEKQLRFNEMIQKMKEREEKRKARGQFSSIRCCPEEHVVSTGINKDGHGTYKCLNCGTIAMDS